MYSTVVTVGTSAVDLLAEAGIEGGTDLSFVIVPRTDVCVVSDSSGTYDEASYGTAGPTGDVESLAGSTAATSVWVVAAGAGVKVALFWGS